MDHHLPETISVADELAGPLEPAALTCPVPSRRRWTVLVASVVMQLALGGIYAWSTFAVPLRQGHGLTNAQTQMIFGLTIALLTTSQIISGRLQIRHGPRRVALLGAVLYGSGYVIAGYSGGSFPVLLVGIGLIGGLGTGLAYLCPVTSCLCWFPERKGLITGIAVAGFGAGAIVLSVVARVAFNHGWDVLRFFCWMGPVWGAIVLLSALFLSTPALAPGEELPERPLFLTLLRRRDFQRLVLGTYCISFAGLTVIGSLEPMGRAASLAPAIATLAISLLAVGNSVGRITWGGVYDRVGRASVPAALFCTGLAALAMLSLGRSQPGYLFAAIVTGLTYSATTVLFAAEVATLWGPSLVGVIYPFLSVFTGLAALTGPSITGALYDRTGSYAPALLLSAAVAIIGAALIWKWPHLDDTRPTNDNSRQTAPATRE